MPVNVAIVDDHPEMRKAVRELVESVPEFTVTAEAADGSEAVLLVEEKQPELVVMDVAMPMVSGVEATQQIVARHPAIRIVMLSKYVERFVIQSALDAGARGYVLKQRVVEDLVPALRAVCRGETFVSSPCAD